MLPFPLPPPAPVPAPVSTIVRQAPTTEHTFVVQDGKFLLDGKPFQILAGEMHYLRVPEALWRSRIRMAKAMGLNAISTYVFWNMHEPEKGHFVFSGNADVHRFIQICREEGMYVLLRPGPYACAEWEFGGYPYWLLKNKSMKVRSSDPAFLDAASSYLKALARQTVPLQITHGGNIIMVQVENEYGSYGRDHEYMMKIKSMLSSVGYDVPLYVAEGSSQLADAWIPGTVAGVNGGGWPDITQTVDRYTPGGPYISPEFYPGWLDHWGEPFSSTDGDVKGYEELIRHGVSVSMYMFHGGTNFGFLNGANYGGNYEPSITSYDYDAPLDESGRPTRKYFAFRDVIARVTGRTLPPVPESDPTILFPRTPLTRTGTLWGALPKPIESVQPPTFEDLDQAYGDLLYTTHVSGEGERRLEMSDLRDYAVVMLNRRVVGNLDRRHGQHGLVLTLPAGESELSILVENSGRINYGGKLPDNLKGITKGVTLGGEALTGWKTYPFPLKDPSNLPLDGAVGGPSLYQGKFRLDQTGDAFLDMRSWFKGAVWINGHALGRFWQIGPQQTLYVPGVWLKKGENVVTVFDFAGAPHVYLDGAAKPILTDLHPEPKAPKRPRADLGHVPDLSSISPVVQGSLVAGDAAMTYSFPTRSARYLALKTLSTFGGEDFASLSELELLDAQGRSLDRSKWKVAFVDSEELAAEDGAAENLIDGDPETIWHSVWSTTHTGQPHWVVFDLGADVTASSVRLTPRQGEHPAKLREFEVYFTDRL